MLVGSCWIAHIYTPTGALCYLPAVTTLVGSVLLGQAEGELALFVPVREADGEAVPHLAVAVGGRRDVVGELHVGVAQREVVAAPVALLGVPHGDLQDAVVDGGHDEGAGELQAREGVAVDATGDDHAADVLLEGAEQAVVPVAGRDETPGDGAEALLAGDDQHDDPGRVVGAGVADLDLGLGAGELGLLRRADDLAAEAVVEEDLALLAVDRREAEALVVAEALDGADDQSGRGALLASRLAVRVAGGRGRLGGHGHDVLLTCWSLRTN